MSNSLKNQPQSASGRARVETVPASIVITMSEGADIGFALGAMNAADVRIASVSPKLIVVRVPQSGVRVIVDALEAIGFGVDVGAPATTGEM